MLSRLGLSSEELALAQGIVDHLPSESNLVRVVRTTRACALISTYIVRPDVDRPGLLNYVPDSDVEEVLSLLNGQVLTTDTLDLGDQLYLPESARPSFDYDDDMIAEDQDIWKTGNIVIKRVNSQPSSVRELTIMCSLKHPHILSASGFYFEDGDIYICMPFQEQGDLSDLIYSKQSYFGSMEYREEVWHHGIPSALWVLPVQDRRRYARELLQGLAYLHSQRVVHGDIKPKNLFIDSNHTLRIADFGESLTHAVPLEKGDDRSLRCYERYTWEYGGGYRDPNVETRYYSFEADIWAVAVTLLEMEAGVIPIGVGKNMNLRAIGVDVPFVKLIRRMLDAPLERVTAEEALDLLM